MTKEVQGNSRAGTIDGPRSNRMESVEDCLGLMEHLSQCDKVRCGVRSCSRLKNAIKHAKECKRKGQCSLCKQVIRICVLHAKNCLVTNCKVHFCGMIRVRLSLRQDALKNQSNRLKKDQMRQMVSVTTVGHEIQSQKPVDDEVGLRYGMIPLQRSFSAFSVKSAKSIGCSLEMQRATSYDEKQTSVPEIIGSGLIQAIGTPNGINNNSKDLAPTYEKMDITNY